MNNIFRNLMLLFFIILTACSVTSRPRCVPVLFPYKEYDYKADSYMLKGMYTPEEHGQPTEVLGLKLQMPEGWHYQGAPLKNTGKFLKKDKTLLLKRSTGEDNFTNLIDKQRLIGCSDFDLDQNGSTKSMLDLYVDLYDLTTEQLNNKPDFWQYYILWEKTNSFKDASRLIHYRGKNIDAFQKNIDPQKRSNISVRTQIRIFPKAISPDYYSLTADFSDDAFFADFLEMVDAMNFKNSR